VLGVIPAAGRGTRAYPYTRGIPKSMLEVAGEPNLARVIRLMRDQLGIRDIIVTIGPFGEVIPAYFGDGRSHHVRLRYVENDAIDKGLSYSILLSRPYVDDYFCVILGDECYVDSNHAELLRTDYRRHLVTCGVMEASAREQILENYAVRVRAGRVVSVVEKPREVDGAFLGVGTFLCSPDFYSHLEAALAPGAPRPNDPVSVLGRLCRQGASIASVRLGGLYVNINHRDALNLANNLVRSRDFAQRTMALVLLQKGSQEDTRRTVTEFLALGRFREIVLVSPPGVPLAGATIEGARCLTAPSAMHGDLLRTGLDVADADILFTAQSDGSAAPADVPKFLEYLKDADFVTGTRTTRQLIQQGSNMRGLVRLAHVVLAKLLELVWWSYEPRLTDVGCAYRALWRSTYRLIRPNLRGLGPESWVEMLLEVYKCRKRLIEIPVSFLVRQRNVKERDQTLATFGSIVLLIVSRRLTQASRMQPPGESGACRPP